MENFTNINDEVIEELIDILTRCYYVAIEIDSNSFKISNSKNLPNRIIIKSKIQNTSLKQDLSKYLIKQINKNIKKFSENFAKKYFNQYGQEEITYKLNTDSYTIENFSDKSTKDNNNLKAKIIKRETKNKIEEITKLKFEKLLPLEQGTPESLLILYLEKKIDIRYCNNLHKYLQEITKEKKLNFDLNNKLNSQNINPKDTIPNSFFFRGNKLNYDLSTSLYRNMELPKYEHLINNRIIQSMPASFNNCESFFDKLTILKHFNCPSRILDITSNPLIAAFFALDYYNYNTPSKFGTINCCFSTYSRKIENSQNSYSISKLMALSMTDKQLLPFNSKKIKTAIEKLFEIYNIENDKNKDTKILQGLYILKYYAEELCEYKLLKYINKSLYSTLDKLKNELIDIISAYDYKTPFNLKTIYDDLITINNKLESKDCFFDELEHQLSLINPIYKDITFDDAAINDYYLVQPSLNNERIKNQQGLFILIGSQINKELNGKYLLPNESYLELFSKEFYSESSVPDKRVIYIINNENNEFYTELDKTYGINKGFIYPELEHKVNQIKNDVMFEYGITTDKE